MEATAPAAGSCSAVRNPAWRCLKATWVMSSHATSTVWIGGTSNQTGCLLGHEAELHFWSFCLRYVKEIKELADPARGSNMRQKGKQQQQFQTSPLQFPPQDWLSPQRCTWKHTALSQLRAAGLAEPLGSIQLSFNGAAQDY